MPDGSATAHRFIPKLATAMAEGYGLRALRADALAGLTVAVVALPLSMAIAVASGVAPERGLYSAIVGGAVISTLGGSRFQIGGPAGAFIVLVAATGAKFGLGGLITAVFMSGVLLLGLGLSRAGNLVRRIPHAVTVGFTCAIAVTIAASQLHDLAGLRLSGAEPGPLIPKLTALARAAGTVRPAALAIGAGVAACLLLFSRWRPRFPAMLLAVAAASALVALLHLPAATVASRFGAVAAGLPAPRLPDLSTASLLRLAPSAFAFSLLGAVESLLSAKVADAMTGRRHRSNMELIAQGLANIAAALFGGICVTGTIARTATNIRAGARSPVAGLLHCLFLLGFIALAAPLAGYIPLAALAGVLIVVSWNMAEKAEFVRLMMRPGPAAALIATFALTIGRDLITGVAAGCAVAFVAAVLHRPLTAEGDCGVAHEKPRTGRTG
ncbi:MAG TPA: SulP family inorganic anion transporter [Caulobacteraceae bacterium]|jgi:SulP family sulfate permease|nr:SulP family inorganic anion transporter [Caulobacteraceae bacterium]